MTDRRINRDCDHDRRGVTPMEDTVLAYALLGALLGFFAAVVWWLGG